MRPKSYSINSMRRDYDLFSVENLETKMSRLLVFNLRKIFNFKMFSQ